MHFKLIIKSVKHVIELIGGYLEMSKLFDLGQNWCRISEMALTMVTYMARAIFVISSFRGAIFGVFPIFKAEFMTFIMFITSFFT